MKASPGQRARLLRLRAIEHRVATVRYAAARSAHADVVAVANRLSDLRVDVGLRSGTSGGHDLQGFAGLVDRIDRAQASIALSMIDAEQALMLRDAECVRARIVEEQMARFQADAARREAMDRDSQAAAACPVMPSKRAVRI